MSARPTAVNIKIGADELIQLANTLSADENVSPEDFKERYSNKTFLNFCSFKKSLFNL